MKLSRIVMAVTAMYMLSLSASAQAGTGDGMVRQIRANAFLSHAVVSLTGAHAGAPSCQSSTDDGWAVSTTSQSASAMYSLLLSAASQRSRVTIKGLGSCTANTENVFEITVIFQ